MREICHKGLTELVFKNGSCYTSKRKLLMLLNASVEPDLENRKQIEENKDEPSKILPILLKWISEHTTGAKKLALFYLEKAYYARLNNNTSWIYYLGLCFHYTTDWGTPYHSLSNFAKKVIHYSILGGIGMSLLKLFFNLSADNTETQNGIVQWGLMGAGATSVITSIIQYFKHNNFEKQCDELWMQNKHLIYSQFNSLNTKYQLPENFEEAMNNFDQIMLELRDLCENTSADWILANNGNFINYMVKIANVMNYAFKIVINF